MENAYKETFDRFAMYLFAAFLTPVLFGACFALYMMVAFDNSWTYLSMFLLAAVFSFPLFLIAAVPISLFIDFSKQGKTLPVPKKILMYGGSGGIFGLLAGIWVFGAHDMVSYLTAGIYGVAGGLLHSFVLLLLTKLFR
ncbi:hypothetical protein [Sporosarcina sp. Te-1]|uniref:hypothetical protein n=1 Tax=Sporosarcina sp. Te-1 TaxID=2818390 RepID=UPI001A9D0284|nr:hypothetical protein [Sporosarcina sp. Te-1]QTD41784.1 hypothetical protein J3U78_02715 [Sporosarcina sp. Te-1]